MGVGAAGIDSAEVSAGVGSGSGTTPGSGLGCSG